MKIRIEEKTLAARFWDGERLIAGCKYDWQQNYMECQMIGNGYLVHFGFPCWNNGYDLSDAISKVKMHLRKEYGNVEFVN